MNPPFRDQEKVETCLSHTELGFLISSLCSNTQPFSNIPFSHLGIFPLLSNLHFAGWKKDKQFFVTLEMQTCPFLRKPSRLGEIIRTRGFLDLLADLMSTPKNLRGPSRVSSCIFSELPIGKEDRKILGSYSLSLSISKIQAPGRENSIFQCLFLLYATLNI